MHWWHVLLIFWGLPAVVVCGCTAFSLAVHLYEAATKGGHANIKSHLIVFGIGLVWPIAIPVGCILSRTSTIKV